MGIVSRGIAGRCIGKRRRDDVGIVPYAPPETAYCFGTHVCVPYGSPGDAAYDCSLSCLGVFALKCERDARTEKGHVDL